MRQAVQKLHVRRCHRLTHCLSLVVGCSSLLYILVSVFTFHLIRTRVVSCNRAAKSTVSVSYNYADPPSTCRA